MLFLVLSCSDLPDEFALQKIIWIGPVKFRSSSPYTGGTSKLAQMLYKQCQCECEITIVGSTACEVIKNESSSVSSFNMLENASAVWEFLKGQKLPGVMALDRVYRLLCSVFTSPLCLIVM